MFPLIQFTTKSFYSTITTTPRNLFGQEYCHGHKRVSKKEVKEAFEALSDEKKAVRFFLPIGFK